MTNLEIMEQSVIYTINAFYKENESSVLNGYMSIEQLNEESYRYASRVLTNTVLAPDGTLHSYYTRKNNLRENVASISSFAMKTELLKNAVLFSEYRSLQNYPKNLSTTIQENMRFEYKIDAIANQAAINIENSYKMLDSKIGLESCCWLFVNSLMEPLKRNLDSIRKNDYFIADMESKIDVYYARGESVKENENYFPRK